MKSTPWGKSQTVAHHAEGIEFHSTASHGGFKLSPERADLVAEPYQRYAKAWSGSRLWYEEDVAALAVIVTWPELFSDHTPEQIDRARAMLDHYVHRA